MTSNLRTLFRRLRREERGGVAVMTGIAVTSIVGMAAFVVDLGNVVNAHRQLQAATDSAALAGARDINCCSTGGTAVTTANTYSATAGKRNANANLTVTMASGYPMLRCFSSTGVSCSGSDSANGIVVKQNASVPLYFGPVIGINSVNISATSTAGANGGAPASLDVMIVLDTTASMNNSDSNCTVPGISHPTREDCALYGVRSLLTGFWPTLDKVGLMVFPGITSATVSREYDCSSSTSPTIVAYKSSPTYKIVSLSIDYRTSNTATGLNTASNLVKAARGGASGCTQGLTAVGGVGTFFADAITAAQSDLTTNGRTGVQKVIILLSDGDAGASSGNMTTAKYHNQCQEAITAAQAAATAGTWVYSIAYGASTSSSGSCGVDSPHISACSTMRQIASDSTKFYADTSGGSSDCTSSANSVTDLNDIFTHIGTTVTGSRLLPDSTM